MRTSATLNTVRSGAAEAPPLVLLHGFLGAADDWEAIAAGLRRTTHCVMVELPGHGGSRNLDDPAAFTFGGAAACVTAALDELPLTRPVLAGYSMGGRISLQVALNDPGRWRGLVLESASPGIESDLDRLLRQAADEEWATRLEREPLSAFLKDWYAQAMFATPASEADALARMLARRRQNDPAELARAIRGLGTGQQPSLWERLGELTMPVLLVAGEYDHKYVDISARVAAQCPRATRVVVPAAGHNVHVDNPQGYLRALQDFLLSLGR